MGSPAMRFSSAAHSPKSINLQRSEQNGLNVAALFHTTALLHVGHWTVSGVLRMMVSCSVTDNGPFEMARLADRGYVRFLRVA